MSSNIHANNAQDIEMDTVYEEIDDLPNTRNNRRLRFSDLIYEEIDRPPIPPRPDDTDVEDVEDDGVYLSLF